MSSYSRVYDFVIPANGSVYLEVPGDYYKILSNTGNLSTRRDGSNDLKPMYAGRGEKGALFQRLILSDLSGSTNTGQILIASGAEMVDTTLQLVGAVQVRPEVASGNWGNLAAFAANSPVQIIAPAANVNGILVNGGHITAGEVTVVTISIIAKSSPPASIIDGEVILALATTSAVQTANLQKDVLIPPGKGVYAIASGVTTVQAYNSQSLRWKTL